jgi:hypothetical protein
VAGVIDSLTNFVEHPEVVADRIERVAAVIRDPSRVQAGDEQSDSQANGPHLPLWRACSGRSVDQARQGAYAQAAGAPFSSAVGE